MVSYEGDYNMDKELLYWIWLSMVPVSYTHLDVYKRQVLIRPLEIWKS